MKLSALTLLAAISEGRKRILTERYGATEEQLQLVDAADPTNSGTYAEWITRSWINEQSIHLPEDTRVVRADLSKFNRVKGKAEWGQNSKDILSYTVQRLRETLLTVTEVDTSSLPEVTSPVIYQDGTYTMWKVTNPKDAAVLSAKAGWCTKSESTAAHYIGQAPLYTAFKNNEPFFQYHSGGKSGSPQFMNRFNSTMQSAKIMNEEAYNLICKVPEEPELAEVIEKFKAPDLSEAETFSYLKDVLATNPEYAKNNKEFQELEKKFLGQRYKIFDEEELVSLITKYNRTGEVVSKFLDENPRVRGMIKKIEECADFKVLVAALKDSKQFDNNEQEIIYKIPGLFSKVFGLFSKQFDIDAEVAKLRGFIKEGKDSEAYTLASTLVKQISDSFQDRNYGYYHSGGDPAVQIRDSRAFAAAQKYKDIIINFVRPMMSATLTNLANKELPIRELVTELTKSIDEITKAAHSDKRVVEWCNKRKSEILSEAAKRELNSQITPTSTVAEIRKGMGDLYTNLSGTLGNLEEILAPVRDQILLPKIKEEYEALADASAGKTFEELISEFTTKKNEIRQTLESKQLNGDHIIYSAMSVYAKDLLTPGLTEALAEVPKLKAVSDKIEELGLNTYDWAERVGEARKVEIREVRDEKARVRDEARETGDTTVRTRYAPKKEWESYSQKMREWKYTERNRQQTEPQAEKPKLSDKGETFILTSPTIDRGDVLTYFIDQHRRSPELEQLLLSSRDQDRLIKYNREVMDKAVWPELEPILLANNGFNSGYSQAYKQSVYPTTPWAAQEEAAKAYWTAKEPDSSLLNSMLAYNKEHNQGKKWDLFEEKAMKTFTSRWWRDSKTYYSNRLFDPLLAYVKQTKTRLSKDLEKMACDEITEFASSYLFTLIPKAKILDIIEKFSEEEKTKTEKTSSHHFSLFAVLMKELENLV